MVVGDLQREVVEDVRLRDAVGEVWVEVAVVLDVSMARKINIPVS